MSTDFLSNESNFQVSPDNCQREPIHIPGAIQPHGALIAFELHSGRVLHASDNLGQWLSLNNLPALGRSLSDLLGEPAVDAIRAALGKGAATVVRHSVVDLPARPHAGQVQALEALLHLFHGVAIAELEPARPGRDWLQDFGDSLDLLRGADDLEDLVDRIALRVRRLIGFDRVMVYRFDADWNGRVIADAHEPDMESFLDLHFPASDIPAQARELYRSNLVRYIADVTYAPVGVRPWVEPASKQPLDMSQAALRSVSPMHIRYLQNMGVGSTLTVSILVNDRLWGLIACHHREPTQLPLRLRRAFHSLSVTVSYMVSALEQKRLLQATNSVAAAQSLVLDAFSQTQLDFERILEHAAAALLKLGNATGGAFWQGDKCYPFGRWLSPERGKAVLAAVRQALPTVAEELYCSEQLRLTPALAGSELRQVCGVAALALDAFANSGIVWLRPEWRREIAWGGDPDKPMQIETDEHGQPRLTPRNSFARWETTVSGQSRTWSDFDRESLRALAALRQVLAVRESLSQVLLSDRQFRSLVTLQSDAYWQIDRQSRLLVLSKPLRFGQTGGEAVDLIGLFRENGTSQLQIDTLSEKFVSRRPFRDFLLTGRSVSDGDFFAYEMNGEPIFDRDQAICGMHGTLRDVTESRRYEEKLRDAQRVSEAASVAKSQFLATMSHELRTPLNVIMGRFQIIELRCDNAEIRENARFGLRSSQHLLSLINDILDFSSIEAGSLNISPDQPLALAEVVLEAVESSRRYERGSTRLRFDAASMPAERLLGDPLRLKQVLINLIGNALKFTESGDVLIAVHVLDRSESEMRIEFSVRDSGIGMNESQLAGLFLPFRQADMSIRRRFGGSGLGLAISQHLVGMMGGRIQAESEPGVGSRFWFSLVFPVAPDSSELAPVAVDVPTRLAGRSVLVVDDDPESLLVAAQLLSVCGAEVRCALNGREALTVAATAPVPDLIFMDMQMPGMTGPETTARLREQGFTGAIVALTAHAFASDRDTCLAAGMNAVLTKPLLLEPLLALVEPLLEDRKGAASLAR